MFLYGPNNIEEWPTSTWSTMQYVGTIWSGRFPLMWSDAMGLGTPMPIGNRFDISPPFFLFTLLPIRWVISFFYAFYLAIGVIYIFRICKDLEFTNFVKLIMCITFMWSSPTVQFMYSDDWPTAFHSWSLYPVIFFYLRRLIFNNEKKEVVLNTILLGVVSGIWSINGHYGHIATLILLLLIYSLMMINQGFKLLYLCAPFLISLLISSERLYFFVTEIKNFPQDILRHTQNGVSIPQFFYSLVRPFDTIIDQLIKLFVTNGEIRSFNQSLVHSIIDFQVKPFWSLSFDINALRLPLFGTLFFATALAFSFNRLSLNQWKKNTTFSDHKAIAITFIASLTLMFMDPKMLLNIPSSTWQFRDGVVFFGILSSGLFINEKLPAWSKIKYLVPSLLAFHTAQIITSVYPALHQTINNNGLHFYANFMHTGGLTKFLVSNKTKDSPKLFISSDLLCSGCTLAEDGVYGLTDLTFFGIRPFNSNFKSISMDLISPSSVLGHGSIAGYPDLLKNRNMLNVFGIDMVLVKSEVFDMNFTEANHFSLLGSSQLKVDRENTKISLYKNNTAWPDGFLMNPEIILIDSEMRNCKYKGAICKNFEEWSNYLLHDPVKMKGSDGLYKVELSRSNEPRLFVTPKLYRDEWNAYSEQKNLKVEKIGGALVSVLIPADIDKFTLEFKPKSRIALRLISIFTLIIMIMSVTFLLIKLRKN
jgi:hypothetical protein